MISTKNFEVLSCTSIHYNISCPVRYLKGNLNILRNEMDYKSWLGLLINNISIKNKMLSKFPHSKSNLKI